jgi:hypothetical protein
MGSGGMKRKNRRHLPKVGTSTELRYAQHEEQREVFHTGHGRGTNVWAVVIIAVVAVILLSFLGFYFLR